RQRPCISSFAGIRNGRGGSRSAGTGERTIQAGRWSTTHEVIMANSIVTMQVLLSFLDPDSGVTPADQLAAGPSAFAGAEHQYTKNLMTVPTTAGGVAIPLGAVTSPGDFAAINRDSTNFITLYVAVSGNEIAQLDPGKMCLIPL